MKGIVGKKLGMTQLFDAETGEVTPVTVIEAGPCPIVRVKTVDSDGYEAVQLAFEPVAERKVTKPRLGQLGEAGAHRKLVEFRGTTELTPGEAVTVETFEPGDRVKVSGMASARASRARSSATTSTAARSRTAHTTSASRAPSAPRPRPRACSRGSRWPAGWAASASRRSG